MVAALDDTIEVFVNEIPSTEPSADSKFRPRKGTFEVRLSNGEVVESLVGMPRPFRKLRELDFDDLVEAAMKCFAETGGSDSGAKPTKRKEAESQPAVGAKKPRAAPKSKTKKTAAKSMKKTKAKPKAKPKGRAKPKAKLSVATRTTTRMTRSATKKQKTKKQ